MVASVLTTFATPGGAVAPIVGSAFDDFDDGDTADWSFFGGNAAGGIDSPALSPYVLAVGATESYDSSGYEDTLPSWTSGGRNETSPAAFARS